VVFINDFSDMSDYRKRLPEFLEKLEKEILSSGILAEITSREKRRLEIRLCTKVCGDYLDVDILPTPAFNNVKKPGMFQFSVTVTRLYQ